MNLNFMNNLFFYILQLYTPYAPGPHNKAGICAMICAALYTTKLRLVGCEPHMPGQNPFYLLKISS